jgi:hypothetical protein
MNPGTGYKVPQMARERKSPKNGNNISTEELITVSVEGVMGRGSEYGVSHKGKDRGLKKACGLESGFVGSSKSVKTSLGEMGERKERRREARRGG